jgi:hypothetical protein
MSILIPQIEQRQTDIDSNTVHKASKHPSTSKRVPQVKSFRETGHAVQQLARIKPSAHMQPLGNLRAQQSGLGLRPNGHWHSLKGRPASAGGMATGGWKVRGGIPPRGTLGSAQQASDQKPLPHEQGEKTPILSLPELSFADSLSPWLLAKAGFPLDGWKARGGNSPAGCPNCGGCAD